MNKNNLELWLLEADDLINIKEYEEADNLIDKYITMALKETNHKNELSLCFRDFIEYSAYFKNNPLFIKKDVLWSDRLLDQAYLMKGYIYNDTGQYSKALESLKQAYLYNPFNTTILFEKAESHKLLGEFDMMLKTIKFAYQFIYKATDLAKYYVYYALYNLALGNNLEAHALYKIALFYDPLDDLNRKAMLLLEEEQRNKKRNMNMKQVIKLLNKKHINVGIKKQNKALLYELLLIKEVREDSELYTYINNIIKDINKPLI